jgi:dienelactone hydrolase
MNIRSVILSLSLACCGDPALAEPRRIDDYPPRVVITSWDDLLEGIETPEHWQARRAELKARFLDLLRDQHKPAKLPLEIAIHESVDVEGLYERRLISYQVEVGERARAYVGVPQNLSGKAPAIVALHGTYQHGIEQAAGLVDQPDKAYLDQLCRRGFVVIAPEHFVSGERTPPEGAYDTNRFYERHPDWTAAGKFTYEHSLAVDVLAAMDEVDANRIGVMGHSLGGHGAIFLAAYDERVKAAACNCGATFFRHNPDVENWAGDQWYVYFQHLRPGLLKGELPTIDFHEIIALIAPRGFLDVSAMNDGDPAVQRHRVNLLSSVMQVWQLNGAPQNCSFFVHGRGHSVPSSSRQLIYSWLGEQLVAPSSE